jgi:hypothetical protein
VEDAFEPDSELIEMDALEVVDVFPGFDSLL